MFFKRKPITLCRACRENAKLAVVGKVSPTHPGPFHTSEFELIHCPRCDSVYLSPAPTDDDLRVLYEESVQFADDHYTSEEQVERILDYYRGAVRHRRLLPGSQARVLEVGAGYAWVSRASKDSDSSCHTVAQDVSGECAEKCDWVDQYHVGSLDTLPTDEKFDLASMTHVIEHLVDPEAMLGAISRRLKPGGKLFVTAPYRPTGWKPNMGIDAWKNYSYLHVPAHVTYFSRKWFDQVAPRHGMQVVHWDARHEDGQAFELVLQRRS
ncbi:methyltransferase domain-containing protein [Dokdonella sp.]|uniref:methyltransferase domain-containing protein n=1 Tax=Dokdonella sp. TaxID=2291710 RepID=UPI003526EA06